MGQINIIICSWVPLGEVPYTTTHWRFNYIIWERLKWKGVAVRLPAGWQCGSDRPGAFKGHRRVVLIMDMYDIAEAMLEVLG